MKLVNQRGKADGSVDVNGVTYNFSKGVLDVPADVAKVLIGPVWAESKPSTEHKQQSRKAKGGDKSWQ